MRNAGDTPDTLNMLERALWRLFGYSYGLAPWRVYLQASDGTEAYIISFWTKTQATAFVADNPHCPLRTEKKWIKP